MKKMLSGLILSAGILAVGASAQTRDLRHDFVTIDRLRADVAADQARLNQDLRFHRWGAVHEDREVLARDQRRLDFMRRDVRHDRSELYWGR